MHIKSVVEQGFFMNLHSTTKRLIHSSNLFESGKNVRTSSNLNFVTSLILTVIIMLHSSQLYGKSFDRARQNNCMEIKIHKKNTCTYVDMRLMLFLLLHFCVARGRRARSVKFQEKKKS